MNRIPERRCSLWLVRGCRCAGGRLVQTTPMDQAGGFPAGVTSHTGVQRTRTMPLLSDPSVTDRSIGLCLADATSTLSLIRPASR